MTITELILELAGLWREHGDLKVVVSDENGYHTDDLALNVGRHLSGERRLWIEGMG